jgi:DNA helicase II / ATP-dependent DNA helicase PcrA
VLALRQLTGSLPKPYRFRPASDLATEIEWAKNRRVGPYRYLESLGPHEPPVPADLMAGVYRRYEDGKRRRGLIDFEDLLELAIRMFDEDEFARERFRARYAAFTVDEYQDVNLLQQSLLERWLGERDDLCVVGDDFQSIYAFTGATADYLLDMPTRMPGTKTIVLEDNYRSCPQVLTLANRLAATLAGSSKTLRPVVAPGPEPVLRACASPGDETSFIAGRIEQLHADGVAYRDMAILYRVNFRSEDFEEALSAARVPFVVRDGGFLERAAARRILPPLKGRRWTDVAARVRRAAEAAGWLEDTTERLGESELTRQRDLSRLVRLAEELDDGERSAGDFVEEVGRRFGSGREGIGVNLLTLHRAKGLEFEAVFLPRLQEGELPFRRASGDEAVEEERRLLYVGITRARAHLCISWSGGAKAAPSRFLGALGGDRIAAPQAPARPRRDLEDDGVTRHLKAWRLERARRDGVPAYVVLHDRTIEAIARTAPATPLELGRVEGIGPTKLERYGEEILRALAEGSL